MQKCNWYAMYSDENMKQNKSLQSWNKYKRQKYHWDNYANLVGILDKVNVNIKSFNSSSVKDIWTGIRVLKESQQVV